MLIVDDGENTNVTLRNHPTRDLGTRDVEVSNVVYISRDDAISLAQDKEVRLMELYNIKIKDIDLENKKIITASYLHNEIVRDMMKIQWVSDKNMTCYKILVPKELYLNDKFNPNSLEIIEGYAEASVLQLKSRTPIQLTRFGFCNTQDKTSAIFIHR
jgi:glutamyl-tRNA synthetase